jgi:hypothetical protein
MEPGMWLTARTRTGIRPCRTVAGALLVALLLAGCASPIFAPGGSAAPASDNDQRPLDRVHRQAQDALVRWADAVRESGGASIDFVGEMTSQIGTWEADVGENNQAALIAGMVQAVTDLSTDPPSRREVKWLDETKVDVNVLSAAAALEALVAEGNDGCPECEPLRVTDATLATSLVETSRGPAEAPTWVYSIARTSVRITRVAVDESITVRPPPWNADDPPTGVSIEWAKGADDARRLEVGFIGARDDGPCAATYAAEAVESELAIVVIITSRPQVGVRGSPERGVCTSEGSMRTTEVRLAEALGTRAVLEIQQGLPVPVHAPG